jgi:dihydrofolate synthase/folylpolyglutamate synthase
MFGLNKFGDGIGLERIARFYRAERVDTGTLSTRSIVVTGSNGKGSTARMLAGCLRASGLRVGCFTSPHLFDYRERFVIDDDMIPADAFARHARTVLAFNAAQPEDDRLGAFEFLFLIAILWFEEQAPDVIVWEAGIGGRYDPVRTVRARLSLLTSVELEHTQLLGATEELIAYDKSDALAPGGVLVVAPAVESWLHDRLRAYCALSNKTCVIAADQLEPSRIANTASGATFSLPGGRAVRLGLIGDHQASNAVAALAAASAWLGDRDLDAMIDALARVRWPGRLERVASAPDLWIDVGHTPNAIDLVTRAFLDFHPREKTLVVFGVSASKEVRAIAAMVAERFDRFILTQAHKAGAPVSAFLDVFDNRDAQIEPDTAAAAEAARAIAKRDGLSVLALGGLFLAVEIQHAWTGGDPRKLEFL